MDTEKAMDRLGRIAISLHCWQGDDVGGFESAEGLSGGGIMATGNYPGKARTADELRADVEKALSLIPGKHRLNLHAMYAETGGKGRAQRARAGALRSAGSTGPRPTGSAWTSTPPTSPIPRRPTASRCPVADEGIRQFWVEHGIACRKIGAAMGKALGTPCVTNVWIPDGLKDMPVDRKGPRERLEEVARRDASPSRSIRKHLLDAVEGKLFGIGSESYVVGSHEFYLGYAVANKKLLCLDAGHFHPTEVIADKISAVLTFVDEILLHVSRGVRWDSDHVVILTDDLRGHRRRRSSAATTWTASTSAWTSSTPASTASRPG